MAQTLKQNNETLDEAIHRYYISQTQKNLDNIIKASSGLIYYFIKLYGSGRSENDLYQVGVEGLLKAIKRYNRDNGASFTTFSGHCIMGEIRHFIRKEASYYTPGCITGLQYRVDKEIEIALAQTGKVPSITEIADKLNIKEESVTEVMRAGLVSFDDINTSLIANKRLETFRLPIEDKLVLAQAMNKLSEIQKKVIYLLFYKDMTQEQAATKLGVPQRKVSRIKEKSLQILKDELVENEK